MEEPREQGLLSYRYYLSASEIVTIGVLEFGYWVIQSVVLLLLPLVPTHKVVYY